jgi:hypothetical protein
MQMRVPDVSSVDFGRSIVSRYTYTLSKSILCTTRSHTHEGDNSIAEFSDMPGIRLLTTAVLDSVLQTELRESDLL